MKNIVLIFSLIVAVSFPAEAQELYDAAKKAAQKRYANYTRYAAMDYSAE